VAEEFSFYSLLSSTETENGVAITPHHLMLSR